MKFNKAKKSVRPTEMHTIKNLEDYYAEAKIDGARYRIIRDESGNTKIISKRVSVTTGDYVEKTENFPQFHYKLLPDSFYFDIEVEMVVGDGKNCSSKLVTAISGSLPERAVQLQEENGYLKGIVIDVHSNCGKNFENESLKRKRLEIGYLNEALKACGEENLLLLPKMYPDTHNDLCTTALMDFYEECLKEGFEGVMLKHKTKNEWIKIKKLDTWDYVIAGFQETESEDFKSRGMNVGSIIMGYVDKDSSENLNDLKDNLDLKRPNQLTAIIKNTLFILDTEKGKGYPVVQCGTCGGFDHSLRESFSSNPEKYIGKVIKVSGQELDKKLGVRHPRFEGFHEAKSAIEVTAEDLKRQEKE